MAIPIFKPPKPPRATPAPSAPSGSSGTSRPSGGAPRHSGNTSRPSGGGKTSDPYAKYRAQQKADEKKAKRKASTRYLEQAATMQKQAKALRMALGKKGFRAALETSLANVDLITRQQDRMLRRDFRTRLRSLREAEVDNEKAAAGASYANLANRGQERMAALAEATANGAGESDMLRAQQMSLANWNANQNEINRSFYDTRTSVNASIRDLNADTRTARINVATEADADRQQLWTTYYNQRSETLTNLGNTLGQMAEYYGMAKEADGRGGKQRKRTAKASGAAFRQAAKVAGKAYESPGIPKNLRQWEGAPVSEDRLNNSKFASAGTEIAPKKPEGASLRSWA